MQGIDSAQVWCSMSLVRNLRSSTEYAIQEQVVCSKFCECWELVNYTCMRGYVAKDAAKISTSILQHEEDSYL